MSTNDDQIFAGANGKYRVVLTAGVLVQLFSQCRRALGNETGGVLAGKYSDDKRSAVVTHLSSLPTDSKAGRTWLVRGVKGLKAWLASLWHSNSGYYLGEWHFHPGGSSDPSATDTQQMRLIAQSAQYRCPEPILVIIGGVTDENWSISVTVFPREGNCRN